MGEQRLINRRQKVATQLAGLLRFEDSPDFARLADVLLALSVAQPPIEQAVWNAVARIARGCVHTIAQRYALDLSTWHASDLWQTLVWSVWYTRTYAPQHMAASVDDLLHYYAQNLSSGEFVTKSRAGVTLLIPWLSNADLVRLDALLAQTQLARSQIRDRIAERLGPPLATPNVEPDAPPKPPASDTVPGTPIAPLNAVIPKQRADVSIATLL